MSLLDLCARCGRCLVVCPVYKTSRKETLSPRGRVRLVQDLLTGDEASPEPIFTCLLCGACEEACPNDLSLLTAFLAARKELHPTLKGLLAQAWPKALKAVEMGLALFEKARPASKPFVKRRRLSPRGDVVLFLGCGANFLYPEVTEKLVDLLTHMGLTPGLPLGQGCCGLATLALGEEKAFWQLAQANLEALAGKEKVVVLCASCAFTLKELYPRLFSGTPWEDQAQALSQRVEEATGFLLAQGAKWVAHPAGVLHLPCHQRFLSCASWWKEGSWPVLEACCGQGGSFGLFYPALSKAIAKTWRQGLAQLSFVPEVLLTNCTACLLRFKQERLPGLEVRFPLEFLE